MSEDVKEDIIPKPPKPDLKIIGNVFGWIIAILLIIMGIALMTEIIGMGLFFLLLGISVIPQIRSYINSKINAFLGKSCTKNWQIKIGTGFIKFFVFFIIFVICVVITPSNDTATPHSKQHVTESKYRNNRNTKIIAETVGLSKDNAAKAYETLVSCGVGNITSIELLYENKGAINSYAVEGYGIPSKITVYIDKKGNVPDVYYEMKPIVEQGKRVAKIQDYILSYEEWGELRVEAQFYIEKFLFAPKTAKFHNFKYTISESKVITVTGTVEAKNAFGVPLEYPFLLQYKKGDNGFSLVGGGIVN